MFPAGLGDMAVSNTIGSNVFDILVGLGIPWGLQTMVVNYGSTVSSSHFLSEMMLDTCASQGANMVLALQLGAPGGALPRLLCRLAAALCKGVQSSLGVPARGRPCLPGTHRCFSCEHPPVASRGGKG